MPCLRALSLRSVFPPVSRPLCLDSARTEHARKKKRAPPAQETRPLFTGGCHAYLMLTVPNLSAVELALSSDPSPDTPQ